MLRKRRAKLRAEGTARAKVLRMQIGQEVHSGQKFLRRDSRHPRGMGLRCVRCAPNKISFCGLSHSHTRSGKDSRRKDLKRCLDHPWAAWGGHSGLRVTGTHMGVSGS